MLSSCLSWGGQKAEEAVQCPALQRRQAVDRSELRNLFVLVLTLSRRLAESLAQVWATSSSYTGWEGSSMMASSHVLPLPRSATEGPWLECQTSLLAFLVIPDSLANSSSFKLPKKLRLPKRTTESTVARQKRSSCFWTDAERFYGLHEVHTLVSLRKKRFNVYCSPVQSVV